MKGGSRWWRAIKLLVKIFVLQELLVNLNYSDPQDAESELAVLGAGSLNLAYEAEDVVGVAAAPASRLLQPPVRGGGGGGGGAQQGYRVKLGHDIYYCKPYQPFHTQLRYNFSGQWRTIK